MAEVVLSVKPSGFSFQYTNEFGNKDFKQVPQVLIPSDQLASRELFTGISIQDFKLNGVPIDLNEAVRVLDKARAASTRWSPFQYPAGLTHSEHIHFADAKGVLVEETGLSEAWRVVQDSGTTVTDVMQSE